METKVVARLKGPFSLSGEVRLQFIDSELADYIVKNKVPLYSPSDAISLTPKSYRVVPKGIAFRFIEIPDRNAAERLSKGEITAPIDLLPKIDTDNYDLSDLISMTLQKSDNTSIAVVQNAYNFGASDIIECVTIAKLSKEAKEFTAPLSPDVIIDIDFDNKVILVTDMIDYFIIA